MPDPVETPRRNLTGAVAPAIAAAALAGLGALLVVSLNGREKAAVPAAVEGCILEGADAIGGPIDLVDSNGARVTQADFAGAPAVIYFGFTNCPYACPTTMYALAEALSLPGGYDVQPILISVDPGRDTPERIGQYAATEGFPEGLVGLTGTPAQIEAAKRSFHVYAQRVETSGASDAYTVDHSSLLYVVDGQWRTVAAMRTVGRENPNDPRSAEVAATPQDLAACISQGLERAGLMGSQRS